MLSEISPPIVQVQFAQSRPRSMGFIYFYDHEDPLTEWLGNFYPVSVEYNGLVFANSEAAFQAQKFIHRSDLMAEFTTLSGDQAFRRARELREWIRSDWFDVNVGVMRGVLVAKIEQNPELARRLEATRDAYLIEHNPVKGRDAFWSDDHDGTGKNMLGILWMEIRGEFYGHY